jgi:uncharacterized membrane protein YgaE (UPF0421/DUF939 family)
MTELVSFLHQLLQQEGLVGLVIGFLILGPGFTYFRTRTIHAQTEAKAQALVNEFARQERQRADRLEEQLNAALRKVESTEEAVASLRLKLAEAQNELGEMTTLRQQVRRLTRRVRELETAVEEKNRANHELHQMLQQHAGKFEQPLNRPELAAPSDTNPSDP